LKTEEIFDMLTGIDEKLIADVGEDLENHRFYSGKAYPADEKRGFSWKPAAAAMVCAAAVVLGALFIAKYVGKTDIPIDNSSYVYSSDGSSSTPPPASSGDTSSNTPSTKPALGYYDDVFIETILENPSVGMPFTYNEVMELLTNPRYGELDSFYLVEAVELMTLPECESLPGFEDWFYKLNGVKYDEVREKGADYFYDNVFYRVKVIEDLISGEKCDYEIYTAIDYAISTGAVSPIYQKSADPPYAPGEQFTLVLYNKEGNSAFARSGVGNNLRLDVKEIDGVPFAFARLRSDFSAFNFDGTEKVSETVVTSTTNNPVMYDAKIKLSDLSDFLRRDWRYRGVGSAEKTGVSGDIMRIAEAYKNAGISLSDEQIQQLSNLFLYQNANPGWERLPYQEGIITGEVDPNAPRLDLAAAKKIISEHNDFKEIRSEFEKVQRPDYIGGSGHTVILYGIDDLGSEIVIFPDEMQIHYSKANSDGTKQTETLFE